jgi:hypothetical protein
VPINASLIDEHRVNAYMIVRPAFFERLPKERSTNENVVYYSRRLVNECKQNKPKSTTIAAFLFQRTSER